MKMRAAFAAACAVVVTGVLVDRAHSGSEMIPQRENNAWLVDQAKAAIGVEAAHVFRLGLPLIEGEPFEVTLPIDGESRLVRLRPFSVRAEGFQIVRALGNGAFEQVDPGPVRTFRGEVVGLKGAVVSGHLGGEGLTAQIVMPDGTKLVVEPLVAHVVGAGFEDHTVYRSDELLGELGSTCGVEGAVMGEGQWAELDRSMNLDRGVSNLKVAEVACDMDVEWWNKFGSDSGATTRIESIINSINTQYESQVGIRHEITTIIIRSIEPDPYSSTESGTLLGQFRSHWLSSMGAFSRDMAHLFSGKNFDGSIIGVAWVGVVCNTNLHYGTSQFLSSFGCMTDLVAHEMGHNWNAPHCSCPSNTMNSGLTCANNFATSTRNTIISFKNSRGCLSNPPPATAPGAFGLLTPAVDATGVATFQPFFQWETAVDALNYQLLVDDDPAFGSPEIDQLSNLTSVTIPGEPLSMATQYFWKVIASNAIGDTTSSPTSSGFISQGLPPSNPLLVLPTPGSSETTTEVSFLWTEGAGTAEYLIEVDDNGDFSSPEISVGSIPPTGSGTVSYDAAPGVLVDGDTYNWRVTATNLIGESISTPSSQSFTVQLTPVSCDGDANGDNLVDVNDISYVLFRLGNSGAPGTVDGDANADGIVDVNDISYVLFRLGPC